MMYINQIANILYQQLFSEYDDATGRSAQTVKQQYSVVLVLFVHPLNPMPMFGIKSAWVSVFLIKRNIIKSTICSFLLIIFLHTYDHS